MVECVSNIFIDIGMSIIWGLAEKIKRTGGNKQDKKEEAKMASKKEKDSNAKKDWTDDDTSLLIDEASSCLWDVYHTD